MFLTRQKKIHIAVAAAFGIGVMLIAVIFIFGHKDEGCSYPYKEIGGLCCEDNDDDGACDDSEVSASEIELVVVKAEGFDVELSAGGSGNMSAVRYVDVYNGNEEPVLLYVGCEGYLLAKEKHVACSPWIDQPDGVLPMFEVEALKSESFAISFNSVSASRAALVGEYETNVKVVLRGVGGRAAYENVADFPVRINVR